MNRQPKIFLLGDYYVKYIPSFFKTFQQQKLTKNYTKTKGKKSAAEAYSERFRRSKMDFFAKIVDGIKPLIAFAKSLILDAQLGSE